MFEFQNDYKWSSGTNEFPDHLSGYGEVEETTESIGLSQFPAAACAQLDLKTMSMSNCNSLMRPGRSPSPFIAISPQKSDRGAGGYCQDGSSAPGMTVDLTQSQRGMSAQMPLTTSVPYCVGGPSNPIMPSSSHQLAHSNDSDSPTMSSSIRLYLNQSAG